jgi:hypothetical protein
VPGFAVATPPELPNAFVVDIAACAFAAPEARERASALTVATNAICLAPSAVFDAPMVIFSSQVNIPGKAGRFRASPAHEQIGPSHSIKAA